MVMFYNILLLDDTVWGLETQVERRRMLKSLVRHISGRAGVGAREVIELSSVDAEGRLSGAFARAIAQRVGRIRTQKLRQPLLLIQ